MTVVRVNLVPAAYALRCRRSRRLRRWVQAGAVAVGVQIAAAALLRPVGSQARFLQRGLIDAEQQQRALNKRLVDLSVEEADLKKQMELAEHLNRKHRWSGLLSALAASLPNTVVLTRCETDPIKSGAASAQVVQANQPGNAAPAEAEPPDVARGLVITGVAVDHDSVAALLRNFNGTGRAGRCSLESTMRQPYLNGEGVFFTIRTRW
ncbi:MAG: PilN domain-containing protein [Planctomycetes bacterium]|nr:PilN domain-containing protein [Planctomycetota bacterium]